MNASSGTPFFLPPHKEEVGGVDYLGLRAINLQMMDELLPGLNNVARHIRPFALLAWAIWHYEQIKLRQGQSMSSMEFGRFREKVECLFILSHRIAQLPLGQIAGAGQLIPSGAIATLRFEDLGRTPSNTLMSAVTYGPGLKGESGFRFAYTEPTAPGCFKVTKAGERLAIALDEQLRRVLSHEHYLFLGSLSQFDIATDEVGEFATAWHFASPTPAEQGAFYARLSPADDVGPREQARVAMLALIRTTLESQQGPVTLHQLRRALTRGSIQHGHVSQFEVKLKWRALQIRQAQRLATEVLFGWLERCIWQEDARTTDHFLQLLTAAVGRARPEWIIDKLILDRHSYFSSLAADSDSLFDCASTHPDCDLVTAAAVLAEGSDDLVRHDEVVANALDLLVLVAVHTEHFMRVPALVPFVAGGAMHRQPLHWWAATLRSHADLPFHRFAERLIETWLVSQHLSVAASRLTSDGGRMRLSIDDAGIGSLLASEDKCWSPVLTLDRLAVSLSLLSECGRISQSADSGGEIFYAVQV